LGDDEDMPNKIKIAMNQAGVTVSDLGGKTGIPLPKLRHLLSLYAVSFEDAKKISRALHVQQGDIFVFQGNQAFARERGGDLKITGNKLLTAMALADVTIEELAKSSGLEVEHILDLLSFTCAARPTEAEKVGEVLNVDYNDVFVHTVPDGFFVRKKGGRL
jgi:hypothetical protein